MATSRVKTNLFLTFEIAAKWQYVCYTQRPYWLISLNQPKKRGAHQFKHALCNGNLRYMHFDYSRDQRVGT